MLKRSEKEKERFADKWEEEVVKEIKEMKDRMEQNQLPTLVEQGEKTNGRNQEEKT